VFRYEMRCISTSPSKLAMNPALNEAHLSRAKN
jgi:hypothetical protein